MTLHDGIGTPGIDTRAAVVAARDEIFRRVENHRKLDYDVYRLQKRGRYYARENGSADWAALVPAWLGVRARQVWEFKVYLVLLALVGAALWFVVRDVARAYDGDPASTIEAVGEAGR